VGYFSKELMRLTEPRLKFGSQGNTEQDSGTAVSQLKQKQPIGLHTP
jgi:hypothetical protein